METPPDSVRLCRTMGPTKEERAYGINLDTDLNPIIPPCHALAPDQGPFEQNDSPNKPKEQEHEQI